MAAPPTNPSRRKDAGAIDFHPRPTQQYTTPLPNTKVIVYVLDGEAEGPPDKIPPGITAYSVGQGRTAGHAIAFKGAKKTTPKGKPLELDWVLLNRTLGKIVMRAYFEDRDEDYSVIKKTVFVQEVPISLSI